MKRADTVPGGQQVDAIKPIEIEGLDVALVDRTGGPAEGRLVGPECVASMLVVLQKQAVSKTRRHAQGKTPGSRKQLDRTETLFPPFV